MKYEIDTIIIEGNHKGKTIKDVLLKDKKHIFLLIKNGDEFSNEVLEKAGIKKKIHHVKTNSNTLFTKDGLETITELDLDKSFKKTTHKNLQIEDDIFNDDLDNEIYNSNFMLRGTLIYDIENNLNVDDIETDFSDEINEDDEENEDIF